LGFLYNSIINNIFKMKVKYLDFGKVKTAYPAAVKARDDCEDRGDLILRKELEELIDTVNLSTNEYDDLEVAFNNMIIRRDVIIRAFNKAKEIIQH